MKYVRLLIFLLLSTSSVFCSEDKIIEAIEDSNPDLLHSLLIPGFLIRLEDKKRYVSLAQEVTNKTYAQLHSFSASDLIRFFKGIGYTTFGGVAGAAGYFSYQAGKPFSIVLDKLKGDFEQGGAVTAGAVAPTVSVTLDGPKIDLVNEKIIAGTCGALSAYFVLKGLKNIKEIFTSEARKKRHQRALTVEAMIQRLPAFDNGCFVPGSLS